MQNNENYKITKIQMFGENYVKQLWTFIKSMPSIFAFFRFYIRFHFNVENESQKKK